MARKTRKTQKQFGVSAGAEDVAKFGSLAAGAIGYTTDPAQIQSLVQYDQGWQGAAISMSPAIEDRNALDFLFAYQLQYLLESGIPEWDAGTTYYIGQVVSVGNQYGDQYVSLADTNLNHAVTDTLYWRKINGQVTAVKTSAFTLAPADNGCIIPCNSVGAAFNITLPTGGAAKNFSFTIKDVTGNFGTNPVSIVRIGSEKIENMAATFVCNKPYRAYTFYTDGTDWFLRSTSFATRADEYVGDGTHTISGVLPGALNVPLSDTSRPVFVVQQKSTTPGSSRGMVVGGGANSSDYSALFKDAAGNNIAQFRGDKILEMVGGGIKFPASQVASADANTLDDYEEGTFTPSLDYEVTGTVSFGYLARSGGYVKIGNLVFFVITITCNAFTKGSATGTVMVRGLPFTAEAALAACTVVCSAWAFGTGVPVGRVVSSATSVALNLQATNATLANIGDPNANSTVYVAGSYRV